MISTPLTTASSARLTAWLDRSMLVAVFVACAFAMSHNFADPDLWGHVQYGRDALDEGLPATATYTYTAEGHRWINHENLCEFLLAWGVATVGPGGLLLIKNLLGIGVMLLIYRHARCQGVAATPLYVSMLLVALNLVHSWSLRPHVMTYILFALMIALFEWCFMGWRTPWSVLRGREQVEEEGELSWDERQRRQRWLWLLVPLFVIWANSHGGFVAGYCIMAAYLAGRACEALVRYRRDALPWVAWCGVLVVACGLATLVNPYGVELHRWLLRALGVPRPEVVEWNSPLLWSLIWPGWWCMLALSVVALLLTRRPRDLVQLAVLALTIWQACEHRRHIAFFAILFGFWLPVHVDSLLQRIRSWRGQEQRDLRLAPPLRWALLGVILLAVGAMSYQLCLRMQRIPVRVAGYPVAAFQYITDQNLNGNLVVGFKWAQYAIATFGPPSTERPQLKVAFDGRFRTCYPQEVLDMFFDFFMGDAPLEQRYRSPHSPPIDGTRILEYKNPNLVLIGRAQEYPAQILERQPDRWTVLYQDSIAQLWGRRDIYDDPQHPDYLPPAQRVLGDEVQQGEVPWPALPRRRNSELQNVSLRN